MANIEEEPTGEEVIQEIIDRKAKIRRVARSTHPDEGQPRTFSPEPDFEPADLITLENVEPPVEMSDAKVGDAAMQQDIAKRALVGLEVVNEDEKRLTVIENTPLANSRQEGIHKLSVFNMKRGLSGDGIKRNLLQVQSVPELIHATAELTDAEKTESGGSTYWKKLISVHVAGMAKRITFICKTAGSGGTSFDFKLYDTIADARTNINRVYANTGNDAPTENDEVPVDVVGDYPYVNVESPRNAKLYIEIVANATSVTGWEWQVIIDGEERVIVVPAGEL